MVLASTYRDWVYLKQLNGRTPTAVDILDFSDFTSIHSIDALDAIYPKVRGQLDPPPNYLTTGAKIRTWCTYTQTKQQHEIDQYAEDEEKRVVTASRDRARLERRTKREEVLSTAHIDQLATESTTPLGGTVPRQNQTAEEVDTSGTYPEVQGPTNDVTDNVTQAQDDIPTFATDELNDDDDDDLNNISKSVTFTVPTPETKTSASASSANRPIPTLKEPPPTKHKRNLNDDLDDCCSDCKGITAKIILKSNCKDKSDILQGYHHLVGNAYRLKGSQISNNGEWNYGDNTVGFLVDHNNKLDGESSFSWKCLETGTNKWNFHRSNCDNSTSMHAECCAQCWNRRHYFYDMCRGEVQLRQSQENGGKAIRGRLDNMQLKSPSIVIPRLEEMGKQIKVLQRKNYRLKAIVDMFEKDSVEISNIRAEVVFDPDELKTHYDNLLSKNEVTEREIFDYLFDECMTVGKRLKAQGANKGHTYSALMIQFACMLRARCSADTYDFFRNAFNMPPNQTLCKYSSSDSTSPQRSHGTNYYPNS